jgi:hypothetical protein
MKQQSKQLSISTQQRDRRFFILSCTKVREQDSSLSLHPGSRIPYASLFCSQRRRCIEERRSSNKNINKLRRMGKGETGPQLLFADAADMKFSALLSPFLLFTLLGSRSLQHTAYSRSRGLSLCTQTQTNCTMGVSL